LREPTHFRSVAARQTLLPSIETSQTSPVHESEKLSREAADLAHHGFDLGVIEWKGLPRPEVAAEAASWHPLLVRNLAAPSSKPFAISDLEYRLICGEE
jgi:hypothetical protein